MNVERQLYCKHSHLQTVECVGFFDWFVLVLFAFFCFFPWVRLNIEARGLNVFWLEFGNKDTDRTSWEEKPR